MGPNANSGVGKAEPYSKMGKN